MNSIEKIQFYRIFKLVLLICPSTLRKVIDDHCRRNGRISLKVLLEKNKHVLFHQLHKRCCCEHQYSGTAPGPVNSFLWESLYIKNSSSCKISKDQREECPCQYDAKTGITTGDMDVTLCCNVIQNMCPELNMKHIKTIRDIRNKFIHRSSMNDKTYKEYRRKVKSAILDIANSVSRDEYMRILNEIDELEDQVWNSHVVEELRKLIPDWKRIENLEENQSEIRSKVCQMTKNHDKMAEDVNQTTERVTQMEGKVDNMTQNMPNLDMLEVSMEKMTQTVTQIEGNIDQTTQTVTQLEGRMNQLTQSIETATKNTTKLEGRMDQMTQTVTKIEEKKDQTTQTVTKLEERMDQMTKQLTKMEGSVQQLTKTVTMLEEYYQRTQNTDAQIEKRVDMTSHIENSVNKSKVTDIEGRVDQMTQKLIQVEKQKQCVIQRTEIGKDFEMLYQHESQTSQNVSQHYETLDISPLRNRLIDNDYKTKVIPSLPQQETRDEVMPTELFRDSVEIREDPQ